MTERLHLHLCVLYRTVQSTAVQYLYFKSRISESEQKSSDDVAGAAKKCQAIMMETKVRIIETVEQGKKMADVTNSYNMNHSICANDVDSNRCGKVMEETEKLLSVWIQD